MNIFTTKPTTVDGVMAAFNQTIADLQTVASVQTAEATRQAEVKAAAEAAEKAAWDEAKRADTIVGKMKALLA